MPLSERVAADCEPNDGGMLVEGDVRLVALPGNSPATAACDDVHFGRVEIFHDGLWGRICGGEEEDFTLDSAVVCRQLGFPFGSVLDEDRPNAFELYRDDYSDYGSISTLPVWATQVRLAHRHLRPNALLGVAQRHAYMYPAIPPVDQPLAEPGLKVSCGV